MDRISIKYCSCEMNMIAMDNWQSWNSVGLLKNNKKFSDETEPDRMLTKRGMRKCGSVCP